MKTITIEELEQLTPGSVTIVDVRPADTYQRGIFEGAINVPMKEFVDRYEEIPKDKPVWVLCHTGERSLDYVELLCSHGYDAGNITGGYRAYLRLQLERFMKEEDARKEKTKEIERSLIKKFRKSIWRSFTRAIQKYDLIQEGDKIVTSNISDIFLPGILIGYATDLTVDSNNMTKSGYILPVAEFDDLKEVLVITRVKETGDVEE